MTRYAILGVGGVGGFVGGALARAGQDVVLVLRRESLARYDGILRVESALLADFEVNVPGAAALDREVDVLWVAPKATRLLDALELAPPERVGEATVIPLLNGLEHMLVLRRRYGDRVAAGSIAVESERVDVGRIRQLSPFAAVELAATAERAAAVCEDVRAAGLACTLRETDDVVLWRKLVLLAPVALTTTARAAPIGAVRADGEWKRRLETCAREACAVASAAGVAVNAEAIVEALRAAPDGLRSSMQKDVEAGRPPELDAIGGALVRAAARYGVAVPVTEELVALAARAAAADVA